MKQAILEQIIKARVERRPIVLATRLSDGAQSIIEGNSVTGLLAQYGELPEAAERVIGNDVGEIRDFPFGRIFLQPFVPSPRLIVVGAVHIAQALVPMAAMTGYDVAVVDPRRAFASDARFPNVQVFGDWPDQALAKLKPDRGTAVVTLTHDPKLDDPALGVALKSDCFYVGALGSRRTHEKRLARLTDMGFGPGDFARIHGPVGLSIGAKSPSEIAISIMAQITQVRRGGSKPA